MSHVVRVIRGLAVLAALAVAGTVYAQQRTLYAGGGAGATIGKFESGFSSGIGDVVETSDKTDNGWKLFAGYHVNRFFAVEFSYADAGKLSYDYASAAGSASTKFHPTARNFSGILSLPLSNTFSLLVKGGAARVKAERTLESSSGALPATLTAAGVPLAGKKSQTNLTWGFGAQYDFGRFLGLRVDYDNYGKVGTSSESGMARVGMWSINAVVGF